MKQALFSIEERERRLGIIEQGVTEQFWKVLKDSMTVYCAVRSREQLELSAEGKDREAGRIAIEVLGLERFMADPGIIIAHNQELFGSLKERIKKMLEQKKEASNV